MRQSDWLRHGRRLQNVASIELNHIRRCKVQASERTLVRRFREEQVNRLDRLHHITTLLRARRRTTLGDLRDETGASRATLMRDLAWLRDELNHPIRWDKNRFSLMN
jgi:hypothetical protein